MYGVLASVSFTNANKASVNCRTIVSDSAASNSKRALGALLQCNRLRHDHCGHDETNEWANVNSYSKSNFKRCLNPLVLFRLIA